MHASSAEELVLSRAISAAGSRPAFVLSRRFTAQTMDESGARESALSIQPQSRTD
jgi:hypothetical protein